MNWKDHPSYRSWRQMKRRCLGVGDNSKYYRERGIKVCDRWMQFANFYSDMGDRPEGMTLDRIDVNGDYTPENCRWSDANEQRRNKRNNHYLEFNGERMCLSAWAEKLGVNRSTIETRIRKGWPMSQILRDKSVRHHINTRKRKAA